MDRALKIKAAEERGAAAVIEFSDPKTEGWDLPEGFVQRGSVSLMSFMVGDVLTPGVPSKPGYERIPLEHNPGLVGIPSLPLASPSRPCYFGALNDFADSSHSLYSLGTMRSIFCNR